VFEVGDDDDLVACPTPHPGDQLDAVGDAIAGYLSPALSLLDTRS